MLGCDCRAGLGDGDSTTTIDFGGWNQTNLPPIAGQSTDPGAQSTGYTWSDVFKQAVGSGVGIAVSRYGGVQPGQYFQQGNNIAYALPKGSAQIGFTNFPGTSGIPGAGNLLVWGGIAVIGLLVVSSLGKHH